MSSHFEIMRMEMADLPLRCSALAGVPALYKKVKKAWGTIEFLSVYESAIKDVKLPEKAAAELKNLHAALKHYPRLVIRDGASDEERNALVAAVSAIEASVKPVLPFSLR